MSMMTEAFSAFIYGIVIGLLSLIPASPELPGLGEVPKLYFSLLPAAYLGSLVAFMFYFREEISRGTFMAVRGTSWGELKYVVLTALITLIIGIPLSRVGASWRTLLSVNIISALLLLVMGAKLPSSALLRELEESLQEKPTPLDAFLAGVSQGLSAIQGISRSGLVALFLLPLGHDGKRLLRLSFEAAPAYLVVKILTTGWSPLSPKWLGPVTFTSAFFATSLGIWGLMRLSEKIETGRFIVLYGLLGVLVSLVGVIL